eukprot:364743-Chlamydomonas_euryale.AAC.96
MLSASESHPEDSDCIKSRIVSNTVHICSCEQTCSCICARVHWCTARRSAIAACTARCARASGQGRHGCHLISQWWGRAPVHTWPCASPLLYSQIWGHPPRAPHRSTIGDTLDHSQASQSCASICASLEQAILGCLQAHAVDAADAGDHAHTLLLTIPIQESA